MRYLPFTLLLIVQAQNCVADTVRVHILSRFHPDSITVLAEPGFSKSISIGDDFPVNFREGSYTIKVSGTDVERSYTGSLTISRVKDELQIVNEVPIEDYVVSVVLSEMGWHPVEAMRAQAVLARTWAVTHRQTNQDYDFDDLTNSQVYKGLFAQSAELSDMLEGGSEILVYRNEAIEAIYHANCGSRVYSAYEIWGGENSPYLANLELPDIAKEAVKNDWTRIIPKARLVPIFSSSNNNRNSLLVRPQIIDGRMGVVVNGHWLGVDNFRLKVNRELGWNTIPSNEFSLVQHNQNLILKGHGLGHLVGLCQRQAIVLAENGWKYSEILQHFYAGAELHQVATVITK